MNGAPDGTTHDATHAKSGPTAGKPRIPRNVGNSAITIENTPHDIDHLIISQLQEDLDAYRYDVDFCKTQLDPDNVATITPAESRTFQLRLLDLGHQMRSIHHRIQVMQATSNGRVGAHTANAYYGPYPPGTSVQPGPQPTNGSYSTAGPSTPYATYHDGNQDRRGPGRPLGSKNRTTLQAAGSGSAKAAALASAGAKRNLTSEIMVAGRKFAILIWGLSSVFFGFFLNRLLTCCVLKRKATHHTMVSTSRQRNPRNPQSDLDSTRAWALPQAITPTPMTTTLRPHRPVSCNRRSETVTTLGCRRRPVKLWHPLVKPSEARQASPRPPLRRRSLPTPSHPPTDLPRETEPIRA